MKHQDRVNILGSLISIKNLEATIDSMINAVQSRKGGYICVSNVHTVIEGLRDKNFAKITNEAFLSTPDGVPLLWASRFLKGPRISGRASGPDILARILEREDAAHLKHYFYGGTPEVIKKLEQRLRGFYKNSKFVGFSSPPFRPLIDPQTPLTEEERSEIAQINSSDPDIVWVGLGAPKQEVWMYRAKNSVNARLLIGVGAAFDFLSDQKSRAPLWMRESGLEWFYRFAQEPTRLYRRYLSTNPAFVYEVAKQIIRERF